METRLPTDIVFKSKDAKYVWYNFHRQDDLARLTDVLYTTSWDQPRVVLLSGNPGSGRRYFLEAACYRAIQAGHAVTLTTLDLDGYETAQGSLEQFANYQLAKHAPAHAERLPRIVEYLQPAVQLATPSIPYFSLLSIALNLDLPLKDLLAALRSTFVHLPGPSRPPRESLSRLLEQLTAHRTLVLHVVDHTQLTDPLRRWLLDEVTLHPRLILAFSCRPDETSEVVAPRTQSVRFACAPLSPSELRTVLNARFQPNTFPGGLYDALWRYSGGLPGYVAIKVFDLLNTDVLRQDKQGRWRVADDEDASPQYVRQFRSTLNEPLDALLARLPAQTSEQLRTLLSFAALCGEVVPVTLLLQAMELAEEEQEALLELLDEQCVEGTPLSFFRDHEYRHPSLPDQLVYTFVNPLLGQLLLERLSAEERVSRATQLLALFKSSIRVQTRASARLCLALAQHLESQEDYEAYARELAWWVDQEEAEELSRFLVQALADGDIAPEVLWAVVENSKDRWPTYRRLAVLEAFARQEGGVPQPLRGRLYATRAELLLTMARFSEALDDALFGLEICEEHSNLAGRLHTVVGLVNKELAQLQPALFHFQRALAISEQAFGPDHPQVATVLEYYATLLHALHRTDEATQYRARAAAIRARHAHGDPAP